MEDSTKLFTEITITHKSLCIISELLKQNIEQITELGRPQDRDLSADLRSREKALASINSALEFNKFTYTP